MAKTDLMTRLAAFAPVAEGRVRLLGSANDVILVDAAIDQPVIRLRATDDPDRVQMIFPAPDHGWEDNADEIYDTRPKPLSEALDAVIGVLAFIDSIAPETEPDPSPKRRRKRRSL